MKQTVLITGASKGIGYALTKILLAENFHVIGTSRTGKILDIKNKNFYPLQLNLSDKESIEKASNEIKAKYKSVDILINNAGIGPDLDTFLPELASFEQTFQVNVTGTVFFTESIINIIPNQGKIINISSEMGALTICERTDSVAYRMSKSALNMYTKILTNRLRDTVKVAAVHPGWVKTTIAEDNIINGRLTAEESASKIFNFINTDFKTGSYWDVASQCNLPW